MGAGIGPHNGRGTTRIAWSTEGARLAARWRLLALSRKPLGHIQNVNRSASSCEQKSLCTQKMHSILASWCAQSSWGVEEPSERLSRAKIWLTG